MAIKLLAVLLILVSCGKEANLSNSALEQSSKLTDPSSIKATSSGVLVRQNGTVKYDQLRANGQLYRVSLNSSLLSLEFIASKPMSSEIPVKYKGSVRNREILLEIIEAQ